MCILLFLSYSFGIETTDKYVHTFPYLIPDQNGQSPYQFSDQNGAKTIPLGSDTYLYACIWEYPWGFNIIMEKTFCLPYFHWSYHRMIQTQIDWVKRKNGNQWQHTKEASSGTNYDLSWHYLSFYPPKHAKHPVWWIKEIVVRIPRQAILHKTNLKYGHRPNRYQTEFM